LKKSLCLQQKLKKCRAGWEEIGASGESGERKVNPGVELAKSLFFGVEVGEGVAREARLSPASRDIAGIARDRKSQTFNHKGHEGTRREPWETYANLG